MTKLEDLALRMARARRQRLDAKRSLSPPIVQTLSESKVEQARFELSHSRREWRLASAALWRLAAKIENGEA